jgi:opacity protein-like surface antigen
MRRVLLVTLLVVLLSPLAEAEGILLGAGASGGLNIPIAQDDQGSGSVFGIMARIRFLSIFVAEPNVTFGKWGEPDAIRGIDLGIDGSKINSYGVNATVGNLPGVEGIKPFAFVGGAIYSVKNDDTGYDESKLGWSLGLGVAYGVAPTFDIDIRGTTVIAPQEEGSKKAAYITGGVTYYFKVGD